MATGAGPRPVTMKMTAENSTRPARKEPSTINSRAVRGCITTSALAEAGDEAGADDLEKDRRAVHRPQREGAGQHQSADPGRDQQREHATARCNGVRHGSHIRPIVAGGN